MLTENTEQLQSKLLKGVRILDFSHYLPGPFASLRLAEMGAEVIKVEPPSGDPARTAGPKSNNKAIVFEANNRGKKSITFNLKQESGREIALRLARESDVLIESFRPGVMKKLGLGYEHIMEVNPKMIYCSISGFGQDGMLSELGSHDINYLALSGALAQLKDDNGRPIHPSNTFADFIGGIAANERILAGLVSRALTGKGSYHSISITEVMATFMVNHVLVEKESGIGNGIEVLNGNTVSYALYETSDRRFVSLGALEAKFWSNFCHGVGRLDWIPFQFKSISSDYPVYKEMTELFRSRSLEEWTEFGIKTDCCLVPVLEAEELSRHPYFLEKGQINANGYVRMHSGIGAEELVPSPEKGEHTEEILKELLNVSTSELSFWREAGII
ncbi:CaiB/BaiF CoA-transferase family protein [Bacillus sp. NEB1478]|uniref:CaiB/BaiF CoA transferase family protein n=1 Tax=Bacillus sp. NEB1478 TaxID=3073816 RepID=UPI002872F851|nr:CaiB/BaiF CoA-transferase family protein [Bacillus sp. NEB1478]WNB92134.1 CaiB/BaiF CoA-transferase family protein [Bacillus sp. NEB1478]